MHFLNDYSFVPFDNFILQKRGTNKNHSNWKINHNMLRLLYITMRFLQKTSFSGKKTVQLFQSHSYFKQLQLMKLLTQLFYYIIAPTFYQFIHRFMGANCVFIYIRNVSFNKFLFKEFLYPAFYYFFINYAIQCYCFS